MKTKHPRPEEVENNDHFPNKGGFEIYKLLYGLQGRVGRLEGTQVVQAILTSVVLAKLFGAF